jgi:Fic family protein
MLYLSLYFKTHREKYYDLLQAVRIKGAWEDWLDFFLTGVVDTTEQAVDAAKRILALFREDHGRIEKLGRPAHSALRLQHAFQERAILSIPGAAKHARMSQPTITRAIAHLAKLGIVRETTGRKRRKLYVYDAYLKILSEGAEPIK